jgi:hypothetical protein
MIKSFTPLFFTVLMVSALAGAPAEAALRYVKGDAPGTNSGTSWANAFTDLQAALTAAVSGDEIWVAKGTYKPTAGTARAVSFQLKSGVGLYGGFAGTETLRSQRNVAANTTILSGDIGTQGDNSDNSYHVVNGSGADATAILDGFTVTAGKAEGTYPQSSGGGIFVDIGSPTIANVTVVGNMAAEYGGGMLVHNGVSALSNMTFTGNMAGKEGGGAFFFYAESTLSNTTFNGNSAVHGGAIYNDGGNPTLVNVTISGNRAFNTGGAIINSGSSPSLTNVTVVGNTADYYTGGMYSYYPSTITVKNSIFWGNTSPHFNPQNTISTHPAGNPTVTFSYCSIEGGCPDGTCDNLFGDPVLGTLGSFGGTTQTVPLLPGSAAINAGDAASCPGTDQRGVARTGGCDLGAFESRSFVIAGFDGSGQYAEVNQHFASPLLATFASPSGDPVEGGRVTFIGPASGAGLSPATSQATITGGMASLDAVANGTAGGPYLVVATASGNSISYQLTNTMGTQSIAVTTPAPVSAKYGETFTVAATGGGSGQPIVYGSSGACTNSGATFTMTASTGTCTITYNQAGNANYYAAPEQMHILAARKGDSTTVLASGANPSEQPTTVTFTATVPAGATGSVSFSDNGSAIAACTGVPLASGSAACSLSTLTRGTHTIVASYGGDTNYLPSSGTLTQTVQDTILPTVTSFTVPVIKTAALDIAISAFAANDSGSGVTGYLITTGSMPPPADDTGWSSTVPTTFTAVGVGSYTLYPWARDGAGNVSTLYGTPVTVEIYPVLVYAAPGGLTNGGCGGWAEACELRYALDNAVTGQEIWAKVGAYKPTADTDRTATFQLKSGVALYGGFAGAETDRLQRNIAANQTILSGDIGVQGDNSDNSYHVVTGANSAVLDGFTITGGNANGSNPFDRGGGMYNDHASPIVSNCTFSGNNASFFGGGMFNYLNSSPALSNCTFSGNSAVVGAGMSNHSYCSPTVTNCTFSGNAASNSGGGMHNISSTPTVTNCTFSGNTASLFAGGGIFNFDGSNATIRNSIFWNIIGGEIQGGAGGSASVSYSVVFNGYSGTGNIKTDPRLAPLGYYGGAVQTFALLPGSSAIDAGDPATCAATDQRGITRPQGSGCDMGAFESQGFVLAKTGGDNQAAAINTSFAAALSLAVTANNASEPVNGGIVTFTPPATGAGLTVTTPFNATIASNAVSSPTVKANGMTGSFTINAATAWAVPVTFSLTNGTEPETIIDSRPDDPLSTTTASFTFHGAGGIPSISFQCALDGSAFIPCTSPQTYNALASGLHTFQVRARDSIGILDSTPAGYSWKVLRTIGIAAVVTDGATIFTAAPGNGIWKSTNGGASWTAAATQPSNLLIMALVQNPGDSTTLYAGSYGDGLFKSVNASGDSANTGMVWSRCTNDGLSGNGLNVVSLAIDPTGRLYAGTEGGIFTSTDCATWNALNNGLTIDATKPPATIVIDPATPTTLYAGLDGSGIYKSTDNGATWAPAAIQPLSKRINAVVIDKNVSSTLYAAAYGSGVYKSPDSGATWSACTTQPANLNLVSLISDASSKLYAGTEDGVFVSTDGCGTWGAMNSGLPN